MLPGFRSSRSCSVKPDSPANFRTASSDSTGPRRCLVRASLKPATLMAKSDLACSRREIVDRAFGEIGSSAAPPMLTGGTSGGLPAPPPPSGTEPRSDLRMLAARLNSDRIFSRDVPAGANPVKDDCGSYFASSSIAAKNSSCLGCPALRAPCLVSASISCMASADK